MAGVVEANGFCSWSGWGTCRRRFLFVREDHRPFCVADTRMAFRWVIEPAPREHPHKAEHPRYCKRWTPSPAEVESEDKPGGNGPADGRSTIEERGSESTLARGKPFRNRLGRGWPVGGFAGAQEETECGKAIEAPGQRSEDGNYGIENYGERQAAPCSGLQSYWRKSRKQFNTRSQTPSIQMRTKRTRKLDSFWRSSRRTPLELARIRSVPAATPGRTEFGEEDTLSPLKLSS